MAENIKISDFKGRRPKVDPRMLPLGYGQEATGVKLGSGAMKGFLSAGSAIATIASVPATIRKFADSWKTWPVQVWTQQAAISGTERLLVATGSGNPTQIDGDLDSTRWGVPGPSDSTYLGVSLGGTEAEPYVVADTVSYCYTLVTDNGEESAPSPATAAKDIPEGRYAKINGFVIPTSSGTTYSAVRVYRLASDAAGNAEFQRVFLRTSATSAQLDQIPVGSIGSTSTYFYDTNYQSTPPADGLSQNLGPLLMTEGWDPPPDGMKGACMFTNGIYAGFKGNLIYLSVPGYYYAMPASGTLDYTMELPYDVVALAAFNEKLVVGTTGYPEVISGTDPAFMTRTALPYQQPCLSAKGMVSLPGGVVYPSPDGLFMISSAGGTVLTKDVIDRETWAALDLDAMICVYHNEKIWMFFQGDDTAMVFDPETDYLVDISLSYDVYDVFVDPEDDVLYYSGFPSMGVIVPWEGGTSRVTGTWKSGIIETAPVNFGAARVEGVFPTGHSTVLYYYVDGVLKHTQTITNDSPFRLPGGFRGRDHEVKISFSGATITAIYLALHMEDLANV